MKNRNKNIPSHKAYKKAKKEHKKDFLRLHHLSVKCFVAETNKQKPKNDTKDQNENGRLDFIEEGSWGGLRIPRHIWTHFTSIVTLITTTFRRGRVTFRSHGNRRLERVTFHFESITLLFQRYRIAFRTHFVTLRTYFVTFFMFRYEIFRKGILLQMARLKKEPLSDLALLFSKRMVWSHPIARMVDFEVHKERMKGNLFTFWIWKELKRTFSDLPYEPCMYFSPWMNEQWQINTLISLKFLFKTHNLILESNSPITNWIVHLFTQVKSAEQMTFCGYSFTPMSKYRKRPWNLSKYKNSLLKRTYLDHGMQNAPQVSSETLLHQLVQNKPSTLIWREENTVEFLERQFHSKKLLFVHKRKLSILLNFLFPFVYFICVFSILKCKTLVFKNTTSWTCASHFVGFCYF